MEMLLEVLAFAFIGLIAGFLGGLLGIGGGIFTVPSFLLTFYLFRFPPAYSIHVAIGTSLGVMLFTTASSTWAHILKKGVQWGFLRYYAPGVILGAFLGAMIADFLPAKKLVLLFSLYILCFGTYFLVTASRKVQEENNGQTMPFSTPTTLMGLVTGTVSTILGVGGAPITIPFLTAHKVLLKHAISTSAFVGLLSAFIGSLSYLYFGLAKHLDGGSAGYLYLPAMIVTGVLSVISAPLGARFAYTLSSTALKRIFGLFLIITSIILMRKVY